MQAPSQQLIEEKPKEMAETKTIEQTERLIELESGEQKVNDINIKPKRSCSNPSPGTIVRISLLVVLLTGITIFLGFLIGSNDVQKSMISALDWISDLPKWGSTLLVTAMYTAALLLFCPGTPFNLAAGFLFGLWIGTGVAIGGCVLGALIAFLLGRTIFRDWVKNRMEKRPKFKAVDWAIQKNGLYIVFLTRLSPLFPFPLLNYAFGITKVQVWKYFVGTLVGVTPATFGYTYLGTLMRSLADIWTVTDVSSGDSSSKKTNHIIYLVVGSLVTVLSIIIISFITKRAISKATREYELMHPEESVSKNTELEEVTVAKRSSENNETSEGDAPGEIRPESHPVVELQSL